MHGSAHTRHSDLKILQNLHGFFIRWSINLNERLGRENTVITFSDLEQMATPNNQRSIQFRDWLFDAFSALLVYSSDFCSMPEPVGIGLQWLKHWATKEDVISYLDYTFKAKAPESQNFPQLEIKLPNEKSQCIQILNFIEMLTVFSPNYHFRAPAWQCLCKNLKAEKFLEIHPSDIATSLQDSNPDLFLYVLDVANIFKYQSQPNKRFSLRALGLKQFKSRMSHQRTRPFNIQLNLPVAMSAADVNQINGLFKRSKVASFPVQCSEIGQALSQELQLIIDALQDELLEENHLVSVPASYEPLSLSRVLEIFHLGEKKSGCLPCFSTTSRLSFQERLHMLRDTSFRDRFFNDHKSLSKHTAQNRKSFFQRFYLFDQIQMLQQWYFAFHYAAYGGQHTSQILFDQTNEKFDNFAALVPVLPRVTGYLLLCKICRKIDNGQSMQPSEMHFLRELFSNIKNVNLNASYLTKRQYYTALFVLAIWRKAKATHTDLETYKPFELSDAEPDEDYCLRPNESYFNDRDNSDNENRMQRWAKICKKFPSDYREKKFFHVTDDDDILARLWRFNFLPMSALLCSILVDWSTLWHKHYLAFASTISSCASIGAIILTMLVYTTFMVGFRLRQEAYEPGLLGVWHYWNLAIIPAVVLYAQHWLQINYMHHALLQNLPLSLSICMAALLIGFGLAVVHWLGYQLQGYYDIENSCHSKIQEKLPPRRPANYIELLLSLISLVLLVLLFCCAWMVILKPSLLGQFYKQHILLAKSVTALSIMPLVWLILRLSLHLHDWRFQPTSKVLFSDVMGAIVALTLSALVIMPLSLSSQYFSWIMLAACIFSTLIVTACHRYNIGYRYDLPNIRTQQHVAKSIYALRASKMSPSQFLLLPAKVKYGVTRLLPEKHRQDFERFIKH